MSNVLLVSVATVLIIAVALGIWYMREGFEYKKVDATYDGKNLMRLPTISRGWFAPTGDEDSETQSGTSIPPGALKYSGRPKLSESYGVGYTDERGWIY